MPSGRQYLINALTDFTQSLAAGLGASAQYPGKRGERAGMAAALAAPFQMAQVRRQQQMEEEDRKQRAQQIKDAMLSGNFDKVMQIARMRQGETAQENVVPGVGPLPVGTGAPQTNVLPIPPMQAEMPGGGTASIPIQSAQDQIAIAEKLAQTRRGTEMPFESSPLGIFDKRTGNVTVKPEPRPEPSPRETQPAGVAEYMFYAKQEQDAGRQPMTFAQWQARDKTPARPDKPDYEWVMRGGQPIQIVKGTARPGDRPYDATAERSKPDQGPSDYASERATRTLQSVDELISKVSRWTTGIGSLAKSIPESAARNFDAELTTLKANIAFNELTAMREASKTGGALGNVSNVELQLLQSALGALDSGQSPENVKAQLLKIKGSIERWQKAKTALANQGNVATPPAKDSDAGTTVRSVFGKKP